MSKKIYGIPVATPINPAKVDPVVPADQIAVHVKAYFDEHQITAESIGALPAYELPTAVNNALAQAKESGDFDGPQGEQGPRGDKGDTGATGKTAYQYAKDGGYTGTEEDFAEHLANDALAEIPHVSKGDVISMTDSADSPLQGLAIYGKTTQNGTPTPENPVELVSVGAGGTINTTVMGKNLFDISLFDGKSYCAISGGRLTMSGTPTTAYSQVTANTPVSAGLIGKNVYVSGTVSGDEPYMALRFISADSNTIYQEMYNAGTISSKITIPSGTVRITIVTCLNKGTTGKGMTAIYDNIMLSLSEDTTYEPYKEAQTLTASTPNGLPGIPVSSGGNYTDNTGQQWICDEFDFGRGVYVQRCVLVENFVRVHAYTNCDVYRKTENHAMLGGNTKMSLCTVVSTYGFNSEDRPHFYLYEKDVTVYVPTGFDNSNNTIKVLAALATPIETALSAEDLAQFSTLHTNKPNTTIYNDSCADMEVSYCTPNTAVPMNMGIGANGKVLVVDKHGCVVPADVTSAGAAPAGHVKKTFFTIPADGAASIAFSGITNAMIYCRGFGGDMDAVFNYSGYASGEARQKLTTIVCGEMVSCGLNLETAGQGLTIKNRRTNLDLNVCIDSGLQEATPAITYTADNAKELYTEYPNPPLTLGGEYRTTERYEGKPVYAQLVSLGSISGASTVTWDTTGFNIKDCVDIVIRNQVGAIIDNHQNMASYQYEPAFIKVTTSGVVGVNLYATLKYTKTTD